jgi:hypothetical protein
LPDHCALTTISLRLWRTGLTTQKQQHQPNNFQIHQESPLQRGPVFYPNSGVSEIVASIEYFVSSNIVLNHKTGAFAYLFGGKARMIGRKDGL